MNAVIMIGIPIGSGIKAGTKSTTMTGNTAKKKTGTTIHITGKRRKKAVCSVSCLKCSAAKETETKRPLKELSLRGLLRYSVNMGVERYRSPLSGSRATIIFP